MSTDNDTISNDLAEHSYPDVDLSVPQFTVRAVITGMVLGALLSVVNIYVGLKIGWGINMSVTAALLSYGFYSASAAIFKTRKWNMLENNVNQTGASAGASISNAGLVAPIPALTILTGEELSYPVLVMWLFAVAMMGVVVGIGLRKQMLIQDKLPFPGGIATGETLKEMYAHGKEAIAKVMMLLYGAALGAIIKILMITKVLSKAYLFFTGTIATLGAGAGAKTVALKNLGFAWNPSLLMVAMGAIIGLRAGLWMLVGAIVGWVVIGSHILEQGYVEAGAADGMWFSSMVKWLLWPGVAMMVTASLTSFAFSWRSVLAALKPSRSGQGGAAAHELSRKVFLTTAVVVGLACVVAQYLFFDIGIGLAIGAVGLTFVLAIVAARVSGETGITPVGAMGKVTQLTFGVVAPGSAATNLMAANVTGGAASQCADLLHDQKTGLMIGAAPKFLAYSQMFGVLAGSVAGAAWYMLFVPDPANMLLTEEWAAPAVLQWMTVAEIFRDGIEKMPKGALDAMLIAGIVGVVLAIVERLTPTKWKLFAPSPTAMGIAFCIPAFYAVSMFLGGLLSVILKRVAKNWTLRFLIVLAAGYVAGESIAGVVDALTLVIGG